ncbi:MAG: non-homologous end-joining DNA ligase [Desulfotomaculales bacterium]
MIVAKAAGRNVELTNLEKIFWPGEGLTKAHLIKYYTEIAPVILPYLYNRPLVMKRYPDGIAGKAFYQKEAPEYTPSWIKTHPLSHSQKTVNYIICNDLATLVWLANQACIEMHAFLSKKDELDFPDIVVFDLDPAKGIPFSQVQEVALLIGQVLRKLDLRAFAQTSGARGLHLFVPVNPVYNFQTVCRIALKIAGKITRRHPALATLERKVENRKGKVYIDCLQNGRGKTVAFPYSLRPFPGAPVSTPLSWAEIERGRIEPSAFNIGTVFDRLKEHGDLFRELLILPQSLEKAVEIFFPEKISGRQEISPFFPNAHGS